MTTDSLSGGKRSYVMEVHLLRGVAIICVVALHAIGFMTVLGRWPNMGPLSDHAIRETLWHDSTLLFSLISGLLFSRVLVHRGWRRFFVDRFTNVVVPYLVVSVTLTTVEHFVEHGLQVSLLPLWARRVVGRALLGRAAFEHWYLPILFSLYLLTPVTWWLLRSARPALLLVAALPLVTSRTGILLSPMSVGYFWGAYALGMLIGERYETSLRAVYRHRWLLLGIAGGTSLYLYSYHCRVSDPVNAWPIEALYYIQKMSAAALLLLVLRRWGQRTPRWLVLCATYAFVIYFFHMLALDLLLAIDARFVAQDLPTPVRGVISVSMIVLSVVLCVVIGRAAQLIFGRRSRMLVGA